MNIFTIDIMVESIISHIKEKLVYLRSSAFFQQVIHLTAGSLIAQVITIAASPIVTRIYSPDALGTMALFTSIVGPLAIISTMSYQIAIVLPKNRDYALGLVRLSLYASIIVTVIVILIGSVFGETILTWLGLKSIERYIYLIPVAIILSAFSVVTSQWLIRNQWFLLVSKIAVATALITNIIKITVGYFYPEPLVLMVVFLLGLSLATLVVFFYDSQDMFGGLYKKLSQKDFLRLWCVARKYKDFPLYRTPQNLINILNGSVTVLLLSSLFGLSSAGYYSLTYAVLAVPITVIAGSVYQAIYPKINDVYQNGISITPLISKSTVWLALTGFIPLILMLIFGQEIFTYVFGDKWHRSGEYAQWLSIALFVQYIGRPAIAAIPVLGIQRELLIWEIYDLVSKMLVFYSSYTYGNDDVVVVGAISVMSAVNTLILIMFVIKKGEMDYSQSVKI